MTIFDFISEYQGQIVDDGNGNYRGECVSLVKRYISENGWPYKHGNAIDWQYNGDGFYNWIANTPIGVPVAGDIIVFNYKPYGHIGIVASANVNTVDVFNQNFPHGNETDPAQITRFNYSHVIGWLHPTALDVPQVPAAPVAPQADPTPVVVTPEQISPTPVPIPSVAPVQQEVSTPTEAEQNPEKSETIWDKIISLFKSKGEGMSTIKPGYKTTEFWMSVLVTVVGLLMASGAIPDGSIVERFLGIIAAGLSAMGYSVSRGITKSS